MPVMYSKECPEGTDVGEAQVAAFKAAGWTCEATPAPTTKVEARKAATAAKKAKEADV